MKYKLNRFGAALTAGVLCLALLAGCTSQGASSASTPADSSGVSQEPSGETASDANTYDFPTMGLTAVFPEELTNLLEQQTLSMLNAELPNEDGSALLGAQLWFGAQTGAQTTSDTAVYDSELEQYWDTVGSLGVYHTELTGQLDEFTGCDEHTSLGKSADGAYEYYLSINTKADPELTAVLKQIQTTITEMAPYQAGEDDAPQSEFTGTSLGEFTTQDINGNTVTQGIFKDYDLTMVNIFTTWCSPCVGEIPDLEQLHQQMADQGVNVVGVVLDVLNEKGEVDQDTLEKAQLLAEQTGATYPFLLPDSGYFNGRLTGIDAVPETFFVDSNGNIVGETYSGSGDLAYWLEIVEQTLATLQEGA